MSRVRVFLVIAAIALSTVAMTTPAHAQGDEIPDQCRTIIGCADAGPKPENPGDRGGYAQLLTLGVLACGVTFIMVKITRAARAAQPDPTG